MKGGGGGGESSRPKRMVYHERDGEDGVNVSIKS